MKLTNYINFDRFSRRAKRLIMLGADLVMLPLALWSSFVLRYGELTHDLSPFWWMFPVVSLISIPIFIKLGLYRAVVRFMGSHAVFAVLQAVTLSTLLLATLVLLSGVTGVPRSVFFIYWGVAILYIGGSRFFMRSIFIYLAQPGNKEQRIAIYGAGNAGAQLASSLSHSQDISPVVFIDDDKSLQDSVIHGIKVYPASSLPSLIKSLGVSQVMLAMPTLSRTRRREIVDQLEPYPVHVRTIPGISDLVTGKAKVDEIRDVDLEDLLGRDAVAPDENLLDACIRSKSVMVTGAGGSIGAELCRQILILKPTRLVLFELSEFALYRIDNDLRQIIEKENLHVEVTPLLGSILDNNRLEIVMRRFEIQTVYHAAAYKHVPLVEHNMVEGVKNNIIGTWFTAEAAINSGVDNFVLISTDKAVRPTNVMGASKRFAELVLQGLSLEQESSRNQSELTNNNLSRTRFSMVRFGNVLGSSGSVVPLFNEQIRTGVPITVTHPEIIRYFMSIKEAAQLVIQAGSMGEGGDVFVLDMGEPVKIAELARKMIHLSGLEIKDKNHPEGDIEIVYTGLRPGEKLYEELLIGDNAMSTRHPRILRAMEVTLNWQQVSHYLTKLEKAVNQSDCASIRTLLIDAVDGYTPNNEIEDFLWNVEVNN